MMTAKNIIAIAVLVLLTITAYCQGHIEKTTAGNVYAKEQLIAALSGKKQHNVIDPKKVLIKDSMTAIAVAEPILFSLYGKDAIFEQRPYDTYLVDHYWIILGTLPKRHLGGTFLIILSARDGKILRFTHGK